MKHSTALNPLTKYQQLKLAAEFVQRGMMQNLALDIVNGDINAIMDCCYRMTGTTLINIVGPRTT